MNFYAHMVGDIPAEDLETFDRVRDVMRYLPEIVFDPDTKDWSWHRCTNQISCHLICFALADVLKGKVSVCHGHFQGHYQHSWLLTWNAKAIIDAYPVGGAAPFIVTTDTAAPWMKMYTDAELPMPKDFQARADIVIAECRRIDTLRSDSHGALRQWRDARQSIFDQTYDDGKGTERWSRLADAEHRLMDLARQLGDG